MRNGGLKLEGQVSSFKGINVLLFSLVECWWLRLRRLLLLGSLSCLLCRPCSLRYDRFKLFKKGAAATVESRKATLSKYVTTIFSRYYFGDGGISQQNGRLLPTASSSHLCLRHGASPLSTTHSLGNSRLQFLHLVHCVQGHQSIKKLPSLGILYTDLGLSPPSYP